MRAKFSCGSCNFFKVIVLIRSATRRALCANFIPHVESRLVAEWVAPHSIAQEYDIVWDPKGAAETHRVIGILYVDEATQLLGGERIYAGERCARLMLGDALYDSLPSL